MPVHVSHGAVEMDWCPACRTTSLMVTTVYVLAGEHVHAAGRTVIACQSCD